MSIIEHPRIPPLLGLVILRITILICTLSPKSINAQSASSDSAAMQQLKQTLKLPSTLDWSNSNPCNWQNVRCDSNLRITRIQLGNQGVSGSLPASIANLTNLQVLELMINNISGSLPSLKGLGSIQTLNLHHNQFDSIPIDFFDGLISLQEVYLDNNPFKPWSIPNGLKNALSLKNFSANSANIFGTIPDFLNSDNFPSMIHLHLSNNHLQGSLPMGFSGLGLQSLWLDGQTDSSSSRSLNGTIEFLRNMTELTQIWLNMNHFTGPIPDLSGLTDLRHLNVRDNSLTGPVPLSLTKLSSLTTVNLTNNDLQGPMPYFPPKVSTDLQTGKNSFCLSQPGLDCDSRVNALISILEPFGYPVQFAESWKGNDPCNNWMGITCSNGNITVINLQGKGLRGIISPNFATLTSVQTVILSHNNITGTIPDALTTMPNLKTLDLSYNRLFGKIPIFTHTNVIVSGNSDIGKDQPDIRKRSKMRIVLGAVIGFACLLLVGLLVFLSVRRKRIYEKLQRENTIANENGMTESNQGMTISIRVLRSATNDFNEENVLGRGGFGTVYKGELPDGTKIAVKRMNPEILGGKGLSAFKSEISVLTKVRHRHLVALLGYCLEENEKLLVYEYMSQGALSRHLFDWKDEGLEPLEWIQRLRIAVDVARGVEYLHNLAHQCFIHRDLKPSNILLGDDMRAKVSDFGLVRLAPDGGKASIETKLAGTFGYLAPEYAVMGRITTKVDVYSFGVILMEMMTGRKALDESQPEDSFHLVTWFRRMYINREKDKDGFQKAVDPTIDRAEETLLSLSAVAELASHCCSRDPHLRPDMSHVVNVLSSLTDNWKPAKEDNSDPEDVYGVNLDLSLPHALERWRALGDASLSVLMDYSADDTRTSVSPIRASGFADGR